MHPSLALHRGTDHGKHKIPLGKRCAVGSVVSEDGWIDGHFNRAEKMVCWLRIARGTALSNRTFRTAIVRDGERRQCPDIGMAAADEIGGEELSFAFEELDVAKHGETLADRRVLGSAQGVRQLCGTSVNQVPDVEHVLVTAGTGVPTSGLILG